MSELTDDEIRVKLAEFEGLKVCGEFELPNYLHDLNAVALVEKLLDVHDQSVCIPIEEANWRTRYGNLLIEATGYSNPYDATARQRCLALLKVITPTDGRRDLC